MNKYLKEYLGKQDYNKIKIGAVNWISEWFLKNGSDSKAVIGISGGKDSTVVAKLCVDALGKDRVFGVLMPNGTQADIQVSKDVVDFLGIEACEVNIQAGYDGTLKAIDDAKGYGSFKSIEISKQTRINLAPRIRMSTLYAVSQSIGGRVSNNGNRSERYVGYSTIFGDAAGDFSPLANLTVTEVVLIGKLLGLPESFIQKPPSDGLTGKTDEDILGFSYEELDTYILTGYCEKEEKKALIDKKHKANLFKTLPMPQYSF